MAEKLIVTNYDHNEFVSLIKEAFKEELKEILTLNFLVTDFITYT